MSIQLPDDGSPQAIEAERDNQATFPCSICSKTFTKRLSRNRHVLYCRQRQLKQHHSRKKSCTVCRRAKSRCSETLPQCTRCKAKGLECKYDGERRIDFDLQLLELDGGESRGDEVVGISALGAESADPNMFAAQMWQVSSLNPSSCGNSRVGFQPSRLTQSTGSLLDLLQDDRLNSEWDLSILQDEPLDGVLGSYDLDHIAQDMCSSARQPIMSSHAGLGQAGHLPMELRYFFSASDSTLSKILTQPSSHPTPGNFLEDFSTSNLVAPDMSLLSARAARIEPISSTARKIGLFRRRERSFGSQLSAYYLLQTLRSYPKMMLSGTLPPFIHDYGNLFNDSTQAPSTFLPEPLAICKSIMCLYFSKTSASTSFVWRTIEMELSRLETDYLAFDEKVLMSALQALTIYILMASIEEDNLSPSIDAKMLHVMMAVAAKIENPNYTYSIAQYGEWQEWILQESRDRTFTLLFIINKLFDINPTHDPKICDAILAMPVPAHKFLWHASSYHEWRKGYTDFLQKREGRPSLTYRDMVDLSQMSQMSQSETLGDLDDWFLNLDAFGTFVLMTASSL